MSVPKLEFKDLRADMRVFDIEAEEFGTIIKVVDDDPDWLMLEVKWDREDPMLNDVSYILPETTIGVEVEVDASTLNELVEDIGAPLAEAIDQHGAESVAVMTLVRWE